MPDISAPDPPVDPGPPTDPGPPELPASAKAAKAERLGGTKIYCSTRNRWLTLETESDCPEHGDLARGVLAEIDEGVRTGRWDWDRRLPSGKPEPGYVSWE